MDNVPGGMSSIDEIAIKLSDSNQEIPPWALILMQSMQSILTEIKVVQDLTKRVKELESFKTVNERVTTNLQVENQNLNDRITDLEI